MDEDRAAAWAEAVEEGVLRYGTLALKFAAASLLAAGLHLYEVKKQAQTELCQTGSQPVPEQQRTP